MSALARPEASGPETTEAFEQEALSAVRAALAGIDRLGVAFSGGVDSSVLLAAAVRVLGPSRVVAVLGRLAEPRRGRARRGPPGRPGDRGGAGRGRPPTRASNRPTGPTARTAASTARTSCSPGSRTRSCTPTPWTRSRTARTPRTPRVPTGPAAARPPPTGYWPRSATPGWTRRRCAGSRGPGPALRRQARRPLPASRIPHHTEVSPEKLAQVEQAEAGLRRLGFADSRVRHHGEVARIELPAADLVRAASEPLRTEVRTVVLGAGFRFVALDLGALQSGSSP